MKDIKILAMDVDGTLTDGRIYMGNNGEVMKCFDAKDGYAIHNILPKYQIIPVIITGRISDIVANRCKELEIEEYIQGSKNKVADFVGVMKKLEVSWEEVAYIGDDLNDLEIMKLAGVRGCPADAVSDIISISDFVSSRNGGKGAVREFIEWIVQFREYE